LSSCPKSDAGPDAFRRQRHGPVFAGKLFPFCFITIACGAISGFHSLIASGTTPKILTREGHARTIGYGAMCLESMVAIMALIAACSLEPGVYFSMNIKGVPAETVAKVSALGYDASLEKMNGLAAMIGEKRSLAASAALPRWPSGWPRFSPASFTGPAWTCGITSPSCSRRLFILTTLDAGTRVGRYLLQDFLGQILEAAGGNQKMGPAWLASFLIVAAWGWFLIQGVRDPLGGINSLWPLFGIANQLLAAIALCLATTVILKMQLQDPAPAAPIYAWITLLPLLWLLTVTVTAGVEKFGIRTRRSASWPRPGGAAKSAIALQLAAGRGGDRRLFADDSGHCRAQCAGVDSVAGAAKESRA
jgi:carbon starvation protein